MRDLYRCDQIGSVRILTPSICTKKLACPSLNQSCRTPLPGRYQVACILSLGGFLILSQAICLSCKTLTKSSLCAGTLLASLFQFLRAYTINAQIDTFRNDGHGLVNPPEGLWCDLSLTGSRPDIPPLLSLEGVFGYLTTRVMR